ncbi:hypothetical protein ACHAXR_013169 [Thalassiosira sp. AJA248-18]
MLCYIISHAFMLFSSTDVHTTAFGFQLLNHNSVDFKASRAHLSRNLRQTSSLRHGNNENIIDCSKISTKLDMVRNIDLPEAIVFYGVESMMEIHHNEAADDDDLTTTSCKLRPGVARLLNECQEVGTAALLLSEEIGDEASVKLTFETAWEQSPHIGDGNTKLLETLVESDDPVIHFRCLTSEFLALPAIINTDDGTTDDVDADVSAEYDDEKFELYNLQTNGRSPSPAFLLDSLRSVYIDPRGFGGSSGFGRGQWIEPRRSPMTARTVVFIAGDWTSNNNQVMLYDDDDEDEKCTVKDRCAAARAAGCRVIYLEQLPDQQNGIQDDSQTMNLCDAAIDTLGNDNPRDLQPITLDAICTPGDYWLNPPNPRDDVGNRVAVDDIVEWFRSEREMVENVEDQACVVADEEDEMSEEELAKILADLDGL